MLNLNASASSQSYYYSLFLQDDVRVRPNLTLNLGIRWERDTGTSERYNRTTIGFDFTTPNPPFDPFDKLLRTLANPPPPLRQSARQ